MLSNEQILKLIREKVDHPATVQELLLKLRIPKSARTAFKRRLNALVDSGELVETSRAKRFGVPDKMNLVVGRVSTSPRGFAFVTMDTEEGACKAMEGLNGSMNNGRFIKVHEAPDRPDESVVENYIPRREFRRLY